MTLKKKDNPYALVRPCKHCPFRNNIKPYLNFERAYEIAESIGNGLPFHCHETTTFEEDEEGEEIVGTNDKSKMCAGSLILAKKDGVLFNGIIHRLGVILGYFDPHALDMTSTVYDSFEEFIEAQDR